MLSNRERVQQYLIEHPGVGVREVARSLGINPGTVQRLLRPVKGNGSNGVAPAVAVNVAPSDVAPVASPREALEIVLRAAETGELSKAEIVPVVVERWSMMPGDRLQYDDGHLFRESAPKGRRSVYLKNE